MHAEKRQQAILRRVRETGSMRVTDFAAELGVSPVTVRKDVEVLAERGLVVRVHGGAMSPLDASDIAPSSGGSAWTIGMVVPSASYYYPEVIKGAREAAAAQGIRLILGVSGYDADVERAQAGRLVEDGVDGLLLAPTGFPAPDTDAAPAPRGWYEDLGVPVMLVERRPEGEVAAVEHVATDHAHGARLAVEHLIGIGRRRIALLLRGSTPTAPWITEGYHAGMRAAGSEDAWVGDLGPGGQGTPDYDRPLKEFLDGVVSGRFDAVIVHPDNEALAVLQRLRDRSISVPDDMAVVAYDDEVAALADIPLTAVAPSKYEVGASAVELLARRLADPERPRRRMFILPELRVRASSNG